MSEEKANYIYSMLVPQKIQDKGGQEISRNDFIGFIAYALYKHKKVQWIESYKKENGVDWVPEEETKKWQGDQVYHVGDYQELAEIRFKQIMDQYKKEKVDDFKEDYKRRADQELEITKRQFKANFVREKIEEAVKLTLSEQKPKNFWEKHGISIVQSTVGGFLFTFLTIIILLSFFGFDLLETIGKGLEKLKNL